MKKWLFALGTVLFVSTTQASLHLEPGKFGFQTEYLCYLPTFDDTFFVVDSTNTQVPSGKRKNNVFDFESGVRLEGAYSFCTPTNEIHLKWTHLGAQKKRNVSGRSLFPTQSLPENFLVGFSGTATSNFSFQFNSVEGYYQKDVYLECPLALSLQFGLQYMRFSVNEDVAYLLATSFETDKFRNRTWGIGPELGFLAEFSLFEWDCVSWFLCEGNLSVTFLASAALLASHMDNKGIINSTVPDTGNGLQKIKDDEFWRVVPTWHLRAGLNYERCIDCFCFNHSIFSIEIGYEFTTYVKAFYKTRYVDSVGIADSINYYSNFDMQGPYVAAAITF